MFNKELRPVDKSLMVCRGEIVELWRCSREITALAGTAGCRLLHPVNGTLVVRAVVFRSSREYRGNHGEIRNRVRTLSPRQTFSKLSTSLQRTVYSKLSKSCKDGNNNRSSHCSFYKSASRFGCHNLHRVHTHDIGHFRNVGYIN